METCRDIRSEIKSNPLKDTIADAGRDKKRDMQNNGTSEVHYRTKKGRPGIDDLTRFAYISKSPCSIAIAKVRMNVGLRPRDK